jgi:Tat protein secretion system quality control protein TatD with DNase activity
MVTNQYARGWTDRNRKGECFLVTVLTVGLHPNTVDFTNYPDQNEATLTARINAGMAALREAGLDDAERKVRECVAGQAFQAVMIGAGVRMAPELTPLFERLVNVLNEVAPGVRFCFNTSPETTIDALRRVT